MNFFKKHRITFALVLISLISAFVMVPVILLAAPQMPQGPLLTAR